MNAENCGGIITHTELNKFEETRELQQIELKAENYSGIIVKTESNNFENS